MREQEAKHRKGLIWIDWVLLALIACAIGGGIWYWNVRRGAAEPTVKIEYVLQISRVDELYAAENGGWESLIPIGAEVTTSNATAVLGRVTGVLRRDHLEASVRGGRVVFTKRDGVCDLEITVEGIGVAREGDGIRVSDIRIAAGSAGDFRIGAYYAANSKIISVKRSVSE